MTVVLKQTQPLTVALTGEIDITLSPAIRGGLLMVIDGGHAQLVIDMTGVTFIDCSGINALVAVARHARDAGGHLALRGPTPQLARILRILHLEEALPAVD